MAPKRAPKSPIPAPKKPGRTPEPGKPATPQQKSVQPLPQHKPWSTSVKSGGRGH
jgi:hypothetical protein